MVPFIKWAGSKRRVTSEIRDSLPGGNRLIEPFLGSGAVFLANQHRYSEFLLTDSNADLITLYQEVVRDPSGFIADAQRFFSKNGNVAAAYYERRERFNRLPQGRERAVLFLYLNRHGFNGLCRYNRSGGFNVSFGRYKAPRFPEQELQAFATAIDKASIRRDDFRCAMQEAGVGDVVYCDPPYVPLSPTACFTEYLAAGFSKSDHLELVAEALAATRRGATVVISNHDTVATRKLYHLANSIFTVQVRRSIGAKRGRGLAPEVIATFLPAQCVRMVRQPAHPPL